MDQRYKYIGILVFCVLLAACRKVDLQSYQLGASIGFYKEGITQGRDSLTRSFAVLDINQESDTIELPLRILGEAVNYQRIVSYGVDHELTTADVANYELLGAYVPADSYEGVLKLKVNKTEALKTDEYRIVLELKESEEFVKGPEERIRYLVKINDFLTKPASWEEIRFGEYSQVKYGLIIKETGYHEFSGTHPEVLLYIVGKCRNVLQEYLTLNGVEMLDENEVPVRFP